MLVSAWLVSVVVWPFEKFDVSSVSESLFCFRSYFVINRQSEFLSEYYKSNREADTGFKIILSNVSVFHTKCFLSCRENLICQRGVFSFMVEERC